MAGNIIFYDGEEKYRNRLAGYIRGQREAEFRLSIFSDKELLLQELEKEKESLCLISEADFTEDMRKYGTQRMVFLTEDNLSPREDTMNVFRYQPAANILKELNRLYRRNSPSAAAARGRKTKLYGVYSPAGGCGKTTFSLILAMMLAKRGKTLFLSMEEFSGMKMLLNDTWNRDLGDLMCRFRENPDNLLKSVKDICRSVEELDYIPPMENPRELQCFTQKEWERFFELMLGWGEYEYLVIDAGVIALDICVLLDFCRKIYQPVPGDGIGRRKVEEWEKFMENSGQAQILKRREKVYLPEPVAAQPQMYLRAQLTSEVGDYVRSLL